MFIKIPFAQRDEGISSAVPPFFHQTTCSGISGCSGRVTVAAGRPYFSSGRRLGADLQQLPVPDLSKNRFSAKGNCLLLPFIALTIQLKYCLILYPALRPVSISRRDRPYLSHPARKGHHRSATQPGKGRLRRMMISEPASARASYPHPGAEGVKALFGA
jgi:hypothetical protein